MRNHAEGMGDTMRNLNREQRRSRKGCRKTDPSDNLVKDIHVLLSAGWNRTAKPIGYAHETPFQPLEPGSMDLLPWDKINPLLALQDVLLLYSAPGMTDADVVREASAHGPVSLDEDEARTMHDMVMGWIYPRAGKSRTCECGRCRRQVRVGKGSLSATTFNLLRMIDLRHHVPEHLVPGLNHYFRVMNAVTPLAAVWSGPMSDDEE